MSSCIDAASEQVCYIPCNFCNIILAVSVPSSNLFDIVTVRCGHCTNLWSVNMAAALQSLSWQEIQGPGFTSPDYRIDLATSSRCNKVAMQVSARNNEGIPAINRPPEKRQRVPSAYNQFIKEEIQRIKANNPEISHREAFSTAAKNVSCRTYLGTLPSHSFWADAGDQQSSQTQLVNFLNGSFEREEALGIVADGRLKGDVITVGINNADHMQGLDSRKHLIPKAAL